MVRWVSALSIALALLRPWLLSWAAQAARAADLQTIEIATAGGPCGLSVEPAKSLRAINRGLTCRQSPPIAAKPK
jgi:hypothetical protein